MKKYVYVNKNLKMRLISTKYKSIKHNKIINFKK